MGDTSDNQNAPPSGLPPAPPGVPGGPAPPAFTPVQEAAAKAVGAAAARVVLERPEAQRTAEDVSNGLLRGFRDVHRKHHGCVHGTLKVPAGLPANLQQGVFAHATTYMAWIRFSTSNKRQGADTSPDGRGVAIKLLGVQADGGWIPDGDGKRFGVQDFLFLNAPAFFAADATTMRAAAELEADDQFPSDFFVAPGNLAGFAALVRMAKSQANSPLDLVYYSQTPFQFGPNDIVKFRLRPLHAPAPAPNVRGPNYLFDALDAALSPGKAKAGSAYTFALEVQLWVPQFPLDDATAVWDEAVSSWKVVAELEIPPQAFATELRMELAENISFSPWNGLAAHTPKGTLNRARLYAYHASRTARYGLNGLLEDGLPKYTVKEWQEYQKEPNAVRSTPPEIEISKLKDGILGARSLFPRLGAAVNTIASSFAFPPFVLLMLLGAGVITQHCSQEAWFCAPVALIPYKPPSDSAIPRADLVSDATPGTEDRVWMFRYAPAGAEGSAGIPYWLFEVLPNLFPQHFGTRGNWSEFGFQLEDDQTYYKSYHKLPRGLILTQAVADLGGNQFTLDLQLVTFNCATCHRGEYIDEKSHQSVFVDGMPNLGLDAAGYKLAVFSCFREPGFTAPNVINAINKELGAVNAPALTLLEEGLYAAIVAKARRDAFAKPLEWMALEPANGLGRLDAFGALRFEFLGYAPQSGKIATVDLPSIWNQRREWRERHHWDGNTVSTRARNFGAIIGVGGTPETLRKQNIADVGDWIEKLKAPKYPFARASKEILQRGQGVYQSYCAGCHGTYTDTTVDPSAIATLVSRPTCMTDGLRPPNGVAASPPAGGAANPQPDDEYTDMYRLQAIDQDFVERLNNFGANVGMWAQNAFETRQGYLCPPLDGIWARAPYLHNGSVPTLRDLLDPDGRPVAFERGNPMYDTVNGGFMTVPYPGRRTFRFDVTQPGNGNRGHRHVVPDDPDHSQRDALIAYLLTL